MENKIKVKDINKNGKLDVADVVYWGLITGVNIFSLVCNIIF